MSDNEIGKQLMAVVKGISFIPSKGMDLKRENANIDGDSAMGTMLRYGTETAKTFNMHYLFSPRFCEAHRNGEIHIHDLDFAALTTTCTQIDIKKLFTGGFNTGHGYLREPNTIQTASALACIAIQSNQCDQHGGQSIAQFDYGLAPAVARSFIKNLKFILAIYGIPEEAINDTTDKLKKDAFPGGSYDSFKSLLSKKRLEALALELQQWFNEYTASSIVDKTLNKTDKDCYQAMEALIHNLNTMQSRAGAQVPFSSINYGTDTTPEGRMIIKNILLAEDAGLGDGETPIFPIHIFKVKDGVNGLEGDPNYEFFELACKVSAKRLFPNFEFLDAPFNAYYLKKLPDGTYDPNTEVSTMGCRTRVMGNTYDPTRETTCGRGNLSFTTINLPRIALKHKDDIDGFFAELEEKVHLVHDQLLERLEVQSRRTVRNHPFLMGQGVWLDSEKLGIDDECREVWKHGTLTVGFIGLAETLTALLGKHHGESGDAQALGLEIVGRIRELSDARSKKEKLNFSVIATPAEGLAGRFVKMDRELYGVINGVTDKEFYTNSYHIPVNFKITAFNKIRIEAPYHALCNGGHITYIEMDGDPLQNLEAFKSVVQAMKQMNIGYGAINHPVDRCPICNYTGVIGDECPRCGVKEDQELTEEEIANIRKHHNH